VDRQAGSRLAQRVAAAGLPTCVLPGPDALVAVATMPEVDTVMAAVVGAAGLASTLAAAGAGKQVLLANKEALVLAGPLLIDCARRSGAAILPIDSEHNAVFQCLPSGCATGLPPAGVARIVLTASGGPFLRARREELASATPEQAVAHPNWRMGPKISVDSATLMNKGLELIEACHLFGLGPDAVRVVIHPQSIVHALVEYLDGSVLAQMSQPDMRVPIAHALGWPDRIESGSAALDLIQIAKLSFEVPDFERFPCLGLAQSAARAGGTAPAVLNAANEVAVAAFLARRLNFADIAAVIESVLQRHEPGPVTSLADALAADAWAREQASRALDSVAKQAAGA
jgi:1-deoxy-D-xylulose-5-phosphate reductoisomerase